MKINTEPYPHVDIKIVQWIIHSNYTLRNSNNNYALLLLESDAPLAAPNINTICLPSSIENFDIENCKSTGWGRKTRNDLEFSRVLKKVYPLPIIPNDQCQKELRSTRLGKSYVVHDSFLCAGGKLKDTCDGDGGGPLFCKKNDITQRYYQIGAVIGGIGCKSGVPAVYANIPYTMNWINQQVEQRFGKEGLQYFTP